MLTCKKCVSHHKARQEGFDCRQRERLKHMDNMEVFYGIAMPIFAVNTSGVVTAWNRKMQQLTGLSDGQVINRFLADFLYESTSWDVALSGATSSRTHHLVDSNASADDIHCTITMQDIYARDKSGALYVRVVPNYSYVDNEVLGAVCFVETTPGPGMKKDAIFHNQKIIDVKETVKAETEQKLTAFFAHELRNPLSALDSALNTIPNANYDELISIVSEMQACIKVMSSVMNNLIDVRKFEEGRVTLSVAPMSLRTLLSDIHKTLLPSAKTGVVFTIACTTNERDWVYGDSRRIQQILVNVTANAIKYTLGGSVTLTATRDGDYILFTCVDTGSGIPGAQGESLPEAVYRCGAPSTGLELAVARHIVELCGGTISFESAPTHSGTFCLIRIPLEECGSKLIASSIRNSQVIDQPLRILIVDDIKINRAMMKRRLEKSICSNCIVSEASTGEEALKMCATEKFNVIIVDQYMEEAGGVMVGTDVIFTLRRMGVDSIIVGCSGNDLDEEFTDAGVDIVWPKPIPTNEEIIRQIRDALADSNLYI